MPAELAATTATLAYIAILAALFVYGLDFLYLTAVAWRTLGRRPRAVRPTTWPRVTVQLPIYNELYVARRLIDAAAALDYPAGLLEIQVLDDSTDETVGVVAESVARWQARGIRIGHVRRADRTGFKAGALAHGVTVADGELLAIFDADFVPRPDFLRRTIPVLTADPGLAFVQARWAHTNRNSSLLTRLQALSIDGHFAVEQAARWATGRWFNFNGTAGVWRREALIDAGGWAHDTLTEDLDISYRAFRRGWRAAYLGSVEAPAELPASFNAFRRQQDRWARGSFECAAKHLPAIWRSPLPIGRKVSASLHLTGYGIHLLLLSLSIVYPVMLLASPSADALSPLAVVGVFNLAAVAPTLLFASGQRLLGRHWLRELPVVLALAALGSGLMVNTARAAIQAALGGAGVFERTPKFGLDERGGDWRRLRYQLGVDPIVAVESLLAVLNAWTCLMAIGRGSWGIALYAGIFTVGLASVVGITFIQAIRAAAIGGAARRVERPPDRAGRLRRIAGRLKTPAAAPERPR
jgi:cellulose synthase/poly-beta-1,6-N-acetylglucosamine synthase-like glycosyltransferase